MRGQSEVRGRVENSSERSIKVWLAAAAFIGGAAAVLGLWVGWGGEGHDLAERTPPAPAPVTIVVTAPKTQPLITVLPTRPHPQPVDYDSASAVQGAMRDHGIDCARPSPIAVTPSDQEYMQEGLTCEILHEQVVIVTFSTPQQRARYQAIGEAGTGAYPHWVMGSNWAVASLHFYNVSLIAQFLGGTPQ